MSIASEIQTLLSAKSSIKSKIEEVRNTTIPSSTKIDAYADYLTPDGCYRSAPTANGIYIKYVGGLYSDYNILWENKTPVGVGVKTDSCSFIIHPSEISGTWATAINTSVSGVTTYTVNNYSSIPESTHYDYAGRSNTNAVLNYYKKGTAFTALANNPFADGSIGYIPGSGELGCAGDNYLNINSALTMIGGTPMYVNNYVNNNNKYYYSSTLIQIKIGSYATSYYALTFYGGWSESEQNTSGPVRIFTEF